MHLKDLTVLVIDDSEATRVRIREILKNMGTKAAVVCNSAEAGLAALDEQEIHLILCDWNMSPINGKDFLLDVRKHPKGATIPFVMVTAEAGMDKVTDAIINGVDDYVIKPFSPEQLESKIRGILTRKKLLS